MMEYVKRYFVYFLMGMLFYFISNFIFSYDVKAATYVGGSVNSETITEVPWIWHDGFNWKKYNTNNSVTFFKIRISDIDPGYYNLFLPIYYVSDRIPVATINEVAGFGLITYYDSTIDTRKGTDDMIYSFPICNREVTQATGNDGQNIVEYQTTCADSSTYDKTIYNAYGNTTTDRQNLKIVQFNNIYINSSTIDIYIRFPNNNITSIEFGNLYNAGLVLQDSSAIINNQNENSEKEQQAINDAGNKVSDSVNDVNNSINDSSTDTPDSSFNDYNDKLAKNGVITNLITLPIQLFTNILNSINGTCRTFSLGNLMGTELTLPCINIANYLGKDLWNVIDILFSGLFVLVIAKKMIKVFENFSSMREGDVIGD